MNKFYGVESLKHEDHDKNNEGEKYKDEIAWL